MNRGDEGEGLPYSRARTIAKIAEESDFDTVLLPDEAFISRAPQVECWIALATLAAETKRVRVGPYVTCNGYRHPAILAKMGATLDNISQGRLEFYIGAGGWGQVVTHKAFGLDYPNLRGRVERLKESIRVIRSMWTDGTTTFHGRYYSLTNAICEPKPVQNPMRIWTGGSSDILIGAAAKVADGWDTGFCTLKRFGKMSDKLDDACTRAGRKTSAIKRSMHWHSTLIGRNRSEVEAKKRKFIPPILKAKSGHPTRWIREIPDKEYVERRFLVGTPAEVSQTLSGFIDRGCDSLNFVFPDSDVRGPMELFAEGVLPNLR
jgi:alkanesulfonate monooxygenase SsuD/methylene tetrahydromethanopterin reductase-like flavin-dependent oxidoreductase (luciferase family)